MHLNRKRTRRRVLLAGACSALAAVSFAPPAQAGLTGVEVNEVGGDFDRPVFATHAPGKPNLLFVVEQGGRVEVVKNGSQRERPFINLRRVISNAGEQGLLSIAFPPNYERSGRFYVYFTNRKCDASSGGCDIEVAELRRREKNEKRARLGSLRKVMTIRHRDAANHNGGTAVFGPDRKLWIATGDGGGGGDPFDNARDKSSLLGKLLRINPRKPRGRSRRGYRIPRGNPFVDAPGRDEIWSIGLRNPFRFSFDGEILSIGDVGQSQREEVNILPVGTAKGADFGWPAREGDIAYDPGRPGSGPLLDPIHVYPRPVNPSDSVMRGVSVTGGLFVRDPRLAGTAFDPAGSRYLFGEAFVQPTTRSFVPDVEAQTVSGLTGHDFNLPQVVGFGEDTAGRVHIVSLAGKVYRLDPQVDP